MVCHEFQTAFKIARFNSDSVAISHSSRDDAYVFI